MAHKDGKEGKKKSPFLKSDYAVMGLHFVMVLLLIPAMVPMMPWYKSVPNHVFHTRFTMDRGYSLFSMSDRERKYLTWGRWTSMMCQAQTAYSTPSMAEAAMGATQMMGMFSDKVGDSAKKAQATIGTALGCRMQPQCKMDANSRCMNYSTIHMTAILTACLWATAIVLVFVFPCVRMRGDGTAGQGKKKKKGPSYTCGMVMVVMIFACVFFGFFIFTLMFNMSMTAIKINTYWAPINKGAGFFISLAATLLSFVAVPVAALRYVADAEKDEGAMDTGLMQQDQDMGMQPMMNQQMMNQPMMMQPGMQPMQGSPMMMGGPPQQSTPFGPQF